MIARMDKKLLCQPSNYERQSLKALQSEFGLDSSFRHKSHSVIYDRNFTSFDVLTAQAKASLGGSNAKPGVLQKRLSMRRQLSRFASTESNNIFRPSNLSGEQDVIKEE